MTFDENLSLIHTIDDPGIFKYMHYPGEIIAGCYAVSAFDSEGNESLKSVMVCVDSCNFYEIPNVFTPNGDDMLRRSILRCLTGTGCFFSGPVNPGSTGMVHTRGK